ncbi:MAG: hypothetical protein KDA41_14585, partial [Planctomycetales bacterium]|nr:hypothetical protein [Planctomycetales bacterium]
MSARSKAVLSLVIVSWLGLLWSVGAQERPAPDPKAPSLTQTLGGPDRYLTHVSTDKPIYRPGETLYVRGVVLHALSNKPQTQNTYAAIQVQGPKGDVVASGQANTQDAALGFSWVIPESQSGGQYTVKVSQPGTGDAPAERKFEIRAYRAPRLRSQIRFLRNGYGPGNSVAATLEVTRAEGGAPAGAKVTIIARIDEQEAYRGESSVDEHGRCVARFALPAEIARGEGTLAMVVEDGGVVETASKTIPILLQTVDLTMYPEGGDLVAGVPNRVYFEAFTPAKKPADLAGQVIDSQGKHVVAFRSEHEGRGRFALTPAPGENYFLKITQPAGIATTYPLPEAKPTGVALTALRNAFDGSVEMQLASPQAIDVTLSLAKRDHSLDEKKISLTAGKLHTVQLQAGDVSGALVATARTTDGKPLAERLVFRKPTDRVHVKISPDQPKYVPGGKARLNITATNDAGQPVSAVVGLTVTDDSVQEMLEKRDQAPQLPVMALLENDVKDLADARFYLNPDVQRGPLAVDLLLGTQGWRRFALVDTAKFLADHGDAARRALALRMVTVLEAETLAEPLFALDGAGPRIALGAVRNQALERLDAKFAAPAAAPVPVVAREPAPQGAEPAKPRPDIAAAAAPPVADAQAERPALADELLPARQLAREPEQADRAELRQALEKQQAAQEADGIFRNGVADRRALRKRLANDFVHVRVFAHQVRAERQPGDRKDFSETLYWTAGVKTDDKGQASVEFDLSDAVTSFRVLADAYDNAGTLGADNLAIASVEPFYIEPKLPLEVTTGDVIVLPLAMANATTGALEGRVQIDAGKLVAQTGDAAVQLPAGQRGRALATIPVKDFSGVADIQLTASAGPSVDKVTRTLSVKPLGFPVERGQGGLLDADTSESWEVEVPASLVADSLTARAVVYPTPLASMT